MALSTSRKRPHQNNNDFYADIVRRINSLIGEACRDVERGIRSLRSGQAKAAERTRAFQDAVPRFDQAKCEADRALKDANTKTEDKLAEIGKIQSQIDSMAREISKIEAAIPGYSTLISTYQAELDEHVRTITDLENRIHDYERKRKKRKKKGGLLGGLGIIALPFAPVLGIAALTGGLTQIKSADDARRAVSERKALRQEKQQLLDQQKNQRDGAVSEKSRLESSLSQQRDNLSALKEEEGNLREFSKQLADVSSKLMKLTTHLGTVYGRAKCTATESRLAANNPWASTSVLVSNTRELVKGIGQTKAQLSQGSSQAQEEAKTKELLGQLQTLSTEMDTYWC